MVSTPITATRVQASGNFTRPANTTPYVATDLVANSATAGSVVPITLTFEPQAGKPQPLWLRRLMLTHTKATVTASSFRVWLLDTSPTMTNGDNGTLAGPALSTVLGVHEVDVDILVTGAGAWGAATFDVGLHLIPSTCYALIEANDGYTPASEEVFTLTVTGTPYAP